MAKQAGKVDFKKAIKVAIAQAGMEIVELADKSKVTRQSLYNWLAGRTSPQLKHLEAIANVLKMKVSELIALGED